jgi:tRNA pseudouridine38-40 synthase
VQDHLERALTTILRAPVRVIGAARTDSGVHAEQQVAVFRVAAPIDELKCMKSLHGLLPETIGVTRLAAVADDFHPILAATGKAYCYRVWNGPTRNPFLAPFCWRVHGVLDVAAMREEAASYVGTHDYTSFCAVDSGAKTRERTVTEVSIRTVCELIEIWVVGRGFLKQMVRTMAGTLVDVGAGRLERGAVRRVLAARDRRAAGMTAPAQGLSLVEIFFTDELPAAAEVRLRSEAGVSFRV